MNSLTSFATRGSSALKITSSPHFISSQPATYAALQSSCTVSFASVIHCFSYVASSMSIASPMQVCCFCSGWISIEWWFVAACRMRRFLHALKTSPAVMKELTADIQRIPPRSDHSESLVREHIGNQHFCTDINKQ